MVTANVLSSVNLRDCSQVGGDKGKVKGRKGVVEHIKISREARWSKERERRIREKNSKEDAPTRILLPEGLPTMTMGIKITHNEFCRG